MDLSVPLIAKGAAGVGNHILALREFAFCVQRNV